MTSLQNLALEGNIKGVEILLENNADIETFSKSGFTALYYAAKSPSENAKDVVKIFLDRGAQKMTDREHISPLYWAISNCEEKIAGTLVEAGVDKNELIDSSSESTAVKSSVLHLMATKGNTKAVQLCIDMEMDINQYDSEDKTALYYAVKHEKIDSTRVLLKNDAFFIIQAEAKERTVSAEGHMYIAAAEYESSDMVNILKRAGAEIDKKDESGMTALHHSCASGKSKAVNILLDAGASILERDVSMYQPIHHAVFSSSTEVVEHLFKRSVEIEAVDKDGRTALHHASARCDIPMVKMLLEKGANINSYFQERDKCRTPLYEVLKDIDTDRNKKIDMARFLIDKNAKVDSNQEDDLLRMHYYWAAVNADDVIMRSLGIAHEAIDSYHTVVVDSGNNETFEMRQTTLQYALRRKQPYDVLKRLIDHGASVQIQDSDKMTALHLVPLYTDDEEEIVKLICETGAEINALNKESQTPLYLASKHRKPKIIQYLLKRNANFNKDKDSPPIYVAAKMGEVAILDALKDAGENLDGELKGRLTPLQLACRKDNIKAMKTLIQAKVDVNKATTCTVGETPLQMACKNGSLEAVRVLLGAEADVNQTNNVGIGPLHVCCQRTALCSKSEDIIKTLIDSKADINATDKHRKTAVHYLLGCLKEGVLEFKISRILALLLQNKASITIPDNDELAPLDFLLEHYSKYSRNSKEALHCMILLFEAGCYVTTAGKDKLQELTMLNVVFNGDGINDQTSMDVKAVRQTEMQAWQTPSVMVIGDSTQNTVEALEAHQSLSTLIAGNISMSELLKILSAKKVTDKLIIFNISDFDQSSFMEFVKKDVQVLALVGNGLTLPLIIENESMIFEKINVSHCKILKHSRKNRKMKKNSEGFIPATIYIRNPTRSAIKGVYFHNNNLASLQEDIGRIDGLKIFVAHNNQLQRIPPSLGCRLHYDEFLIHNNPISNIPSGIINDGTGAVLSFLHEFMKSDTTPNTYVKAVVVGHEEVGKTTLLRALRQLDTEGVLKTDGIDISEIHFQKKSKKRFTQGGCFPQSELENKGVVKVKFIDFAGDVDFLETLSLYLTDDTLFLLVFSLGKFADNMVGGMWDQLGRLCLWLETIHAKAPNSRVILVGTNADSPSLTKPILDRSWLQLETLLKSAATEHRQIYTKNPINNCLMCHHDLMVRKHHKGVAGHVQIETEGDRERIEQSGRVDAKYLETEICFPHVVGYFEVSSKTPVPKPRFGSRNISVEQLRDAIHKEALRFVEIQPTIPLLWAEFRDDLKKLAKEKKPPILSFDEYVERAKWMNVCTSQDDKSLMNMTSYLHCQGELLHFSTSETEKHTDVILDLQWLANMLKKLISYNADKIDENGILTPEALKRAWQGDLDTLKEQKALLHLFIDMKICMSTGRFTLEGDEVTNMLFPCKLPVGKPTDDEWSLVNPRSDEPQLTYRMKLSFLPPSFFCDIIAKVDADDKKKYFTRQPKYYKNHIVLWGEKVDWLCKQCKKDYPQTNVSTPHTAHIECNYTSNSLLLTVRGQKPCCYMYHVELYIQTLFERGDYQGLTRETTILCQQCVVKRKPKPAEFPRDVREKVCTNSHQFDKLDDITRGFSHRNVDVIEPRTLIEIDENDCPKVFTILPVGPTAEQFGAVANTHVRDGYAVHFLCEEPGNWHFLSNVPGYHIDNAKLDKFVEEYGKHMCSVLKILKDGIADHQPSTDMQPKEDLPPAYKLIKHIMEKTKQEDKLTLSTILDDFLERHPELKEHAQKTSKEMKQDIKLPMKRLKLIKFLRKPDEEKQFGELYKDVRGTEVIFVCREHKTSLI